MGPTQLSEVLRHLPASTHPDILVGLDSRDDAGVFRLSDTQALVQTVDFFTPIVDDPYAYGAIAAANALSDVYAMGGTPLTVLNIACFDPTAAPPEVWAEVLKGAFDKTTEAGAMVLGGHSVEDDEPKFGMAVTGVVNPNAVFANTNAKVGDKIYLSKPLGAGIVSTAAKRDGCSAEELRAAIETMMQLNADAALVGHRHHVRCATDITGFGLVGHLFNIARSSQVQIELHAASLPVMLGIERMIADRMVPGGARKNREFVGDAFTMDEGVAEWFEALVFDPQSSGGLALFTTEDVLEYPCIGRVVASGEPTIHLRP